MGFDSIIDNIIGNFDFGYMLVVNILTYLIIKVIDDLNAELPVKKVTKVIILCFSITIVSVMYICSGYENYITLVNSAILAPVAWSLVFKPLAKKAGIDYKKMNDLYD